MSDRQRIKAAHESVKRTAKMKKLANFLGLKVAQGQITVEQAMSDVRQAIKNHPAIVANEARN